jgi:uncharacterized protein (DUF362 family)
MPAHEVLRRPHRPRVSAIDRVKAIVETSKSKGDGVAIVARPVLAHARGILVATGAVADRSGAGARS